MHCEFIFRVLISLKCDLGKFEKSMFQGFALHIELIFFLLTSSKCDVFEVDKAMIQVLSWYS